MPHPDTIPATLSDAELLSLWSVSHGRMRLTWRERTRLGELLAAVRQEGIPRGWRFDEAKAREQARRRAERALVSMGGFAA